MDTDKGKGKGKQGTAFGITSTCPFIARSFKQICRVMNSIALVLGAISIIERPFERSNLWEKA